MRMIRQGEICETGLAPEGAVSWIRRCVPHRLKGKLAVPKQLNTTGYRGNGNRNKTTSLTASRVFGLALLRSMVEMPYATCKEPVNNGQPSNGVGRYWLGIGLADLLIESSTRVFGPSIWAAQRRICTSTVLLK